MAKATIVVHSGDLDKIMSALIIGNGYLAMGDEVTLSIRPQAINLLTKEQNSL